MNLLLKLATAFFKIGLLTVGGGLAMIPIIQHEMVSRGWLNNRQFLDILSIAEISPGPLSVNTATFTGYRVCGIEYPGMFWLALAGALVGTLSVCAPSLLCINLLGALWRRNKEHPCMIRVFAILRPLVTGLIINATVLLVINCLWQEPAREWLTHIPDLKSAAFVIVAFLLTIRTRISPITLLFGGAIAGLLVF